MKTQHAYSRTLEWRPRTDADADTVLQILLKGKEPDQNARLVLGDWCLAEGIRAATAHGIPVKIHTGYLAHNNQMELEHARVSRLCGLLREFPDSRFVLMHIASGFESELLAIAKHYQNVTVDLCWAWSINPLTAADFVRRFLHQVPSNKLLAFGGDTGTPTAAIAYSRQARKGLYRALGAEVEAGFLSENGAIALADQLMHQNQYALFPIEDRQELARQIHLEKNDIPD
jgi:predicted TIM-barrel fold metal-dependent hydrolase